MPWETKTVMEQREKFVELAISKTKTISALCREYGISRKTGYKWIKRAQLGQRLADASRCPHRQPSKTAEETEKHIVAMREAHPAWGGKDNLAEEITIRISNEMLGYRECLRLFTSERVLISLLDYQLRHPIIVLLGDDHTRNLPSTCLKSRYNLSLNRKR